MSSFFFFLNQLQASLAPRSADPQGHWTECKLNHAFCNSSQIQFLQGDLLYVFVTLSFPLLHQSLM